MKTILTVTALLLITICSPSARAGDLLAAGAKAPDFNITLTDGTATKLSSLAAKGPVAVYFYPKDDTPGCTKQACTFRDKTSEFEKAGVPIIGISADDAASHAKFTEKYHLTFPLVPDPEKRLIEAYGVKGMFGMAQRTTFLVGKGGTVAKVFEKVNPAENPGEVLEAVKALK